MTAVDTPVGQPYVCWDCGGPCRMHKGSEHGWRCAACLDRHIAAQVAKADAADDRLRAKRRKKFAGLLESDGGLAAGHADLTPSRAST